MKLVKYINANDPNDEHHVLRMYDFFYFKEHLFIVCELLRENLYEFSKYNRDHNEPNYFNMPRLQRITRQCLKVGVPASAAPPPIAPPAALLQLMTTVSEFPSTSSVE